MGRPAAQTPVCIYRKMSPLTDNPKEHLIRLLPAFRTTTLGCVTGWSDLLIDAGLDLYSLGHRHGVEIECRAAMSDSKSGRLELTCNCPPSLREEVEAIRIRLGEETGKRCQTCGKPATPTQNRCGDVQTRCPACLAAARFVSRS